jgi:hypothetical protein
MLTLQAEMMEAHWAANANGEATPGQVDGYQRLVNTLRRVLESLGLERRVRDVTPNRGDATGRIVRAIEDGTYARL